MAIRYAVATGNWSDVSTWDGGVSLPTVGDDVYANGFTVTVDQDIEVNKISTEVCPITSVGGGRFYTSLSGLYIIANIIPGTTTCLDTQIPNQGTITIIGDIYGGDATQTSVYGVYFGVLSNRSINNVTHIGNAYGGEGIDCPAYYFFTGANTTYGNHWLLSITGNAIANNSSVGLNYYNEYTTHSWAPGVEYVIVGNVQSSVTKQAFYSTYNFDCTGIVYANSNTVITPVSSVINATITGKIINGVGGKTAIPFYNLFFTPTQSDAFVIADTITGVNTLYDASLLTDFPSEADVREGTSYASGTLEGTLAVPPPESVVKNVPVDNTVGTWVFDDAVIQRLLNCSTVAITGQQIASYNGAPAELVPTYEKRYDFVAGTPDTMYLGAAPVGTLDASTVWNLTKLVLAVDGSIISETHATDSWDNHLTATYA